MERLIGPNEAAELLGVRLSTIYAWSYRRKIPTLKVGARLRFSPSALGAWLRERERPAIEGNGQATAGVNTRLQPAVRQFPRVEE